MNLKDESKIGTDITETSKEEVNNAEMNKSGMIKA